MNVLFEYLYRDSGNYKNWGEVIFSNKYQVKTAHLEEEIRESIFDRDLDHGWHEFGSVTPCEDKTTDLEDRDIQDFIGSIKSSSIV